MKIIRSTLIVMLLLSMVALPALAQPGGECSSNSPLVAKIEARFGIPFAEFGYFHCQGITLTAIAQAMYLAEIDGDPATDYAYYLNLLLGDPNYPEILASLNVSRSDLAPGKILNGK